MKKGAWTAVGAVAIFGIWATVLRKFIRTAAPTAGTAVDGECCPHQAGHGGCVA